MARISTKFFRPKAVVNSFFGLLDIKSGAEIILLFGLLNKVAGVYGLISLFTGGDFYQLSFYAYSIVTSALFVWGMRAVAEEASSKILTLAHLYTLDHVIQTLYTLHFGFAYWSSPHDGRSVINSQAQKDMIDLAISRGEVAADREGGEALALGLWKQERGTAALVLVAASLIKIYFIIVLYSYAAHLRKNTYHSLPLSSSVSKPTPSTFADDQVDIITSMEADEDAEPSEVVGKGKGKGGDSVGEAGVEEFRWESDEEEGGEGKVGKKDKGLRD